MLNRVPLFILLLCLSRSSYSTDDFPSRRHFNLRALSATGNESLERRSQSIPAQGYFNPYLTGGSLITQVNDTGGLGEPVQVILSANSDAAVLVDQENDGGFRNYMISIGFAAECLGQVDAVHQAANLGDGHGFLNETAVLRWDYGNPITGTCTETVEGGNHVRYWIQNGPDGDSKAIFIAASYELPLNTGHDIELNGYNLGRDQLVGNATQQSINTTTVNNGTTASGSTSFANFTYVTHVQYVSGLLSNTSLGINHNDSVPLPGGTAIDGLVAVLTVNITAQPASAAISSFGSLIGSNVLLISLLTFILCQWTSVF